LRSGTRIRLFIGGKLTLPSDGDGLVQLGAVELDAMGAQRRLERAHHEPSAARFPVDV
jgi:hypothetical protein